MRVGIIGAGKVGTALGHALQAKGLHVVAVSDQEEAGLKMARTYLGDDSLYGRENEEVVRLCDVIAVTTQDREINRVAREIAGKNVDVGGKVFFHTSGAHSSAELSPLARKGALVGSLHPLQTFPDVESGIESLPSTFIFIEGDERSLPVLQTIARAVGYRAVQIEGKNKTLYHLCAVFVCNLLCALLYAGERIMHRIGIQIEPFFPIIRATLNNIEKKGPLLSLTGPVVRGDAGTVRSHIEAMAGMELYGQVYRKLSLVALDMSEERKALTPEQIDELRRILDHPRTD
jgi:predicted short-subunit dehydrogenase-like oxidoreductase (DUF2520 family)